jgi:OOP family OmpA-OmpF porin
MKHLKKIWTVVFLFGFLANATAAALRETETMKSTTNTLSSLETAALKFKQTAKSKKTAKSKQEQAVESEKPAKEISLDKQFNRGFGRLSLEASGGLNALMPTIGSSIVSSRLDGYSTSRISPFHVDLGARFMINRFVGLKANVAYDQVCPGWRIGGRDMTKVSDFKGHYYGVDLQGVINLGQVLRFPEFSGRLGLLAHAGGGYRAFKLDKKLAPGTFVDGIKRDNIITLTWGITPMVKLTDRVTLMLDFSQVYLGKQQTQLDGTKGNHGVVDGLIHNYTLGFSVNLCKKPSIDWAKKPDMNEEILNQFKDEMAMEQEEKLKEIDNLKDRIDALSRTLKKYATAKELDTLKNEINRIINNKEQEVASKAAAQDGASDTAAAEGGAGTGDAISNFVEGRVMAAFFNFDVRTPQAGSIQNIKLLGEFMAAHPNTKVDLTGYTDAIGSKTYNEKLGQDRADNVKNILINQYGIDASRITSTSGGIDNSVNVRDGAARSSVRRVTMTLSNL